MDKTICELFAGVGGFRLGFDILKTGWETKWFSQWEPKQTKQWAHGCYVYHYGECPDIKGEYHTADDICLVDKKNIPDHSVLVGGFPCQDYSVAQLLSSSKGIEGKKGVLWWQIRDTLIAKRPPFVILENVDRLLKSPVSQRGRDFGIILTSFAQLGYRVEWRVVNAAEYGAAQKRRRTFIFAYNKKTKYAKNIDKIDANDIISNIGFMAKSFPILSHDSISSTRILYSDISNIKNFHLFKNNLNGAGQDLLVMSQNFKFDFMTTGYMKDGKVYTSNVTPNTINPILISKIIQKDVNESYYIHQKDMPSWTYMKGSKKIPRKAKNGHEYVFSEGAIPFPDSLDRPARTMLTSEGTKNRSTHVIKDPITKQLRILTPVETERLQGFKDEWTKIALINNQQVIIPDRIRRFCMGNALVVPMITRMAKTLDTIIETE